MSRLLVVVNIIIVLVIFKTNAARILCVFPTTSFSHQLVYRSLTRALATRGHNLVVITSHPFPAGEAPANLTEIDVDEISHRIWHNGINEVFHDTSHGTKTTQLYLKMFTNIFEKQLQTKSVQKLIENESESFDLLVLESHVFSTLGLLNVFDAPVIQTSTYGPTAETYHRFGAPNHPLLYPTAVHLRIYNLTLWEKIKNLYKTATTAYVLYTHERVDNEMLQRNLGFDILPISELYGKVNLYFQTVYPMWMNNPPVPQGIVYLGGLHQQPPNKLPQDIQTFLDSSKRGAIYVSFGSNILPSLLSQEKIDMMARVFSNLPYEVLWKRDEDIRPPSKNILISTWFPQYDILYHPNIKLFVTHGGLQSTEEAIIAGLPLIGIPIFGDQWMHTETYVRFRIGLQLNWNLISEEQLMKSIKSVIEDKSYKENVVRLRDVLLDQPQSPVDHAVWWTEYVLKHGSTQHLLPASANISCLQYYEVELILIVVFVIIFILGVLSLFIFRLACCICRKRTQKKSFKII